MPLLSQLTSIQLFSRLSWRSINTLSTSKTVDIINANNHNSTNNPNNPNNLNKSNNELNNELQQFNPYYEFCCGNGCQVCIREQLDEIEKRKAHNNNINQLIN